MKTRSWNEELKCFIYFEEGYYTYFENGAEKFFLLGSDFGDLITRDGKHYQFNWGAAEIFTGKLDKYGRPLFENDYIEHVGCNGVPDGISQIVWDDEASAFFIKNDNLDIYDYFENVSYKCDLFGNENENWNIICEAVYG